MVVGLGQGASVASSGSVAEGGMVAKVPHGIPELIMHLSGAIYPGHCIKTRWARDG